MAAWELLLVVKKARGGIVTWGQGLWLVMLLWWPGESWLVKFRR
jgi:hypothetical protein